MAVVPQRRRVLDDTHLDFPEHLDKSDIIRRIRETLEQSDEKFLLDPKLDLENYIHRTCWYYGIHPIWTLVALQREQSLIADNGVLASDHAWSRATGVVGQHLPGTSNSSWDGLPNQILLTARTAAWLAGVGTRWLFGYRVGLWPSAARWTDADTAVCKKNCTLLKLDGTLDKTHDCHSRMEYVEYGYTPSEHVRAANWKIYEKYIKPFWE